VTGAPPAGPSPSDDAALAAALLAVDPRGTGASLRAPPGPARDRWLALLRAGLPPDAPVRRLPASAPDGRLLGGLDLAATLAAGRPVAERGLLAEADGGVVLVTMAERLPPAAAAHLAAAMDDGAVAAERDGLALRHPARIGVVALDEGLEAEERPAPALLDRLAFHLALDAPPDPAGAATPAAIAAARARLPGVGAADDTVLRALCETAMALGIDSPRAPLLALRAARASAALAGRPAPSEADAAVAARLVLAPRATRFPAPEQAEGDADEPGEPDTGTERGDDDRTEPGPDSVRDMLVAAAVTALPAGLLAGLASAARRAGATPSQGRAGAPRQAARRGRRIGTRPGDPRAGGRLDLVETLRAAAPWQRLRRGDGAPRGVAIRREDFRLVRFRQETGTTTVFVVDASGSTAVNRLGEAKGAVELLLADCYARRDQVALLAFRGRGAELLLPPTNSLVRAKRSLAALPGGGGTPLAAGLDAALAAADAERRRGRTPTVVVLTDGRANVARDGTTGGDRARAEADALAAARLARAAGVSAVLVDTAPRPRPFARELAAEMGARYLPLPGGSGGADALAGAVRPVAGRGRAGPAVAP
jgi:magnesium chelatase subunit D